MSLRPLIVVAFSLMGCQPTAGTSPDTDITDITDDTDAPDTDRDSGEAGPALSNLRLWDLEIPSGKHNIAFGNGPGIVMQGGEALFVYTDSQRVHVAYADGINAPVSTPIDNFSSAMALAAEGDDAFLIITNQADHQMMGLRSSDFGTTWSQAELLGDGGTGPTVPTMCAWDDGGTTHAMGAWVAPPTSEDGGPMFVSHWDGTKWGDPVSVGTSDLYSAPTLSCEPGRQTLVVRQLDELTNKIYVHLFERDAAGAWTGGGEQFRGADPHFCASGDDYWVGHHSTASSYLGHSTDAGATWTQFELDDSGKFVPAACAPGGRAVACNGDWDTKADAESKGPGRKVLCHATFDGGANYEEFRPVGMETEQGVSNVAMSDTGIAVLWKTAAAVRLAMYDY
jgi:hypothetical protein